ncbi:hypothetical protein [Flavobacterium sp. ASV13]|uniref:hypothetical protein n=1 Tax=Flavobacterium sp. ASV13 TaxID=1506583 RepID=UPI00068B0DB4|nr:hypothetical protein [Flavobacterium sp. ASV13]
MKIKLAFLTPILFVTFLNAQLYTPGGVIQGISTNSNVGIGTSTPNAKLEVDGVVRFGNGINSIGNLSYGTSLITLEGSSSNTSIAILPNGTGNVGIGTTSPISKLDVIGKRNISSLGNSTPVLGSLIGGFNISADGSNNSYGMQSGFYNNGAYWIKSQTSDGSTKAYDISLNPLGGNIGIGTINPANKLEVNGTIHSKEVKVDMNGWSDFVFKKHYALPTLQEVEKHIAEKGHLENIPSEKEVLKNGINLGEMNSKLLQKNEELLYI